MSKLEDLYKSKSIDGVVTYLKNIEGEIKNESKSKEVLLDKYESFKIYSRSCEDLPKSRSNWYNFA